MKISSIYVCQNCGQQSPKWAGKCPGCGEWNSFIETTVSTRSSKSKTQRRNLKTSKPLRLGEVESMQFTRIKTGISELDQVLGGADLPAGGAGIVPGSVVLLAGEPGMGKSTLLTQLVLEVSRYQQPEARSRKPEKKLEAGNIFYVCGEESPGQVKLRIERIAKNQKNTGNRRLAAGSSNLFLLPETNVESIVAVLDKHKARLVIIDSIQTLWTDTLTGMSGSVGQIRETANILADFAKRHNVPVFLVGHVTKEGSIAGPKVLEHLVDTVLYLEGDKNHEFRILRAVKNRFGPTDEVGIFTMGDEGMKEVANPSEIFVESSKNLKSSRSGSCKVVAMQGLRPVVVEIQALVTPTQIPVPRRVGRGVDAKRLQILCAVLQKKAGINLFNQDVYLNVAGGLKLDEPAVDFGICLAVASSYKNKTIPDKIAAVGEVGLLGEIRKVSFLTKRIKQAKALGYNKIAGPEQYGTVREAVRKILK